MASSIYSWSTTAAANATADSDINWSEGQAPSTVNNSARQVMGRVAEFIDDMGSVVTVGGTANAITVLANSGFSAYATGLRLVFKAASDNTAAVTLNVNSIGVKNIRKVSSAGDADIAAGDLKAGCLYEVVYSEALNSSAGGWQLMNLPQVDPDRLVKVGTGMDYWGDTAPSGYIFAYGQAISRTDYAELFAVMGTKFGAGDGSTTFNVPDKRGRASFGLDNMGGTSANRLTDQTGGINGDAIGDTGGSETATLETTNIPAHTHSSGTLSGVAASAGAHIHSITGSINNGNGTGIPGPDGQSGNWFKVGSTTESAGAHTHTVSVTGGNTGSTGSGTAFNTLPPGIVAPYIIFAGV